MTVLFWLAILPSILLARRVLGYDKIEKEPFSLLARLFALGMLSCVPASLIETAGDVALSLFEPSKGLYSALTYLIVVPAAEELSKYWMLRHTWNNKNFNYTFDGIVYGVMVGLGFATLENILYVLSEGTLTIAIMRGILSVPLHCTCGVFMGYYYGVAKGLDAQGLTERSRFARRLCIAVPWIIHGLYDYALDTESEIALVLGLAMTIIVFVLASRQVRFASKHDTPIVAEFSTPDPTVLPRRRDWNDWSSKGTTPPPPVGRY